MQVGDNPPAETTQSPRWSWVEPAVWTERMLTALEQGVKGNRWFSLIDKVYSAGCLTAAARKVVAKQGAAGMDHVTGAAFQERLEEEVSKLSEQLRSGAYRPQPVQRVYIPKPGSKEQRPLGIPTVRDRVVQGAIVKVIEPIFERDFAEQSYGFRPGRGCKDALRRVDALLKAGYEHVVDVDLQRYFDTIPHGPLLERLRTKISDGRLLSLIESFLQANILEGLAEWTPDEGAPQGAVLSPLLSNIYLDPLDHWLAEQGFEMVRYADDFVILCRTAADAERALQLVQQWTSEQGLKLHPEKTRVVHARREGFEFLGYRFHKHYRFPRKKSLQKIRDTIRRLTPRKNGCSLTEIIAKLNRSLRGWFEYFKHSSRTAFAEVDGMVRRRLRRILCKRAHRKYNGFANKRWPNKYFADRGLYDLVTARDSASQSSSR